MKVVLVVVGLVVQCGLPLPLPLPLPWPLPLATVSLVLTELHEGAPSGRVLQSGETLSCSLSFTRSVMPSSYRSQHQQEKKFAGAVEIATPWSMPWRVTHVKRPEAKSQCALSFLKMAGSFAKQQPRSLDAKPRLGESPRLRAFR